MALAFPMTVRNAFDDALLLLGFETGNNAPMYIRERIVTDINAALQFIQAAGEDYCTREALTQATVSGTASYALSNSVQNVFGPVRLNDGTLLRELGTRGEYDLFAQLCQGAASAVNAKPLAYYLQNFRATPTDGDNVGITLFLAPTPDAVYTATLEVAKRAANFTYADLTDATKLIPIPHQYAQSLFLPVLRYNVTTHPWYYHRENLPAIQADYTRALGLLGVNDPSFLPAKDSYADAKRRAARGNLEFQTPQSPPAPATV